jgi:hypothetical protein
VPANISTGLRFSRPERGANICMLPVRFHDIVLMLRTQYEVSNVDQSSVKRKRFTNHSSVRSVSLLNLEVQ